jgi:DNA-binding transcriptional ArsR family regulator
MEEFKQKPELIITDLETLKVVSDPLRQRILELTLIESLTTKQIAEALEAAPSKIYYHVRLLEKHGLIKVAETRLIANMVENLYQTAAESFRVDPRLLLSPTSESSQAFDQVIADLFDEAKAQARRSIRAGLIRLDTSEGERPKLANAHFSHTMIKVRPEKVAEFRRCLKDFLEEFDALDEPKAPDGEFYRLIVGFYPTQVASHNAGKEGEAVNG